PPARARVCAPTRSGGPAASRRLAITNDGRARASASTAGADSNKTTALCVKNPDGIDLLCVSLPAAPIVRRAPLPRRHPGEQVARNRRGSDQPYTRRVPRRRWKDVLSPGLDVVFVGYNPSRLAWRTGFHYANPGNRFYHLLHDAGLTPRRFPPAGCRD